MKDEPYIPNDGARMFGECSDCAIRLPFQPERKFRARRSCCATKRGVSTLPVPRLPAGGLHW